MCGNNEMTTIIELKFIYEISRLSFQNCFLITWIADYKKKSISPQIP
jgi:hypothetical protein